MTRRRRHHHGDGPAGGEAPPRSRWHTRHDRRAGLYRDMRNAKIAGVCAGIAAYFGVKRWLVRAATIVGLVFFTVPTLLLYIIAALAIPPLPDDLYANPEEAEFWREVRVEPRGTVRDLRHKFRDIEQRLRGMEAYVTSAEYRLDRDINKL